MPCRRAASPERASRQTRLARAAVISAWVSALDATIKAYFAMKAAGVQATTKRPVAFLEAVRKSVRRGQRHQCDSAQFGNTANTAGAILCHDHNILLLDRLAPARKFRGKVPSRLRRWRGGGVARLS